MSENDSPTPVSTATPAPNRAEIIAQIAKKIEQRRKDRSLTLEKVSQIIKIRLPYLQAIESGHWDELPGEVYVRGFIKRYAGFLGLDTDALMAPYIGMETVAPKAEPDTKSPIASEMNRLQFLWIAVIGVFVVVFIKLIQNERTAPLRSTAPVAVSSATAVSAPAATPETPAPEAPRAALPKHALQVFSPFPLWLRVTASDRTFEGFIPQGASWTWKGEGTFNIRFGHTKQVVLLFDGQPVPLVDDQKGVTLPNAN